MTNLLRHLQEEMTTLIANTLKPYLKEYWVIRQDRSLFTIGKRHTPLYFIITIQVFDQLTILIDNIQIQGESWRVFELDNPRIIDEAVDWLISRLWEGESPFCNESGVTPPKWLLH